MRREESDNSVCSDLIILTSLKPLATCSVPNTSRGSNPVAQDCGLEEKYHEDALNIYVEFFVLLFSCIVIGLYMFCPTAQYSPPKKCNLASISYSAQERHSVMNHQNTLIRK